MNFPRGKLEPKFDVNHARFPKEKHQNSPKWAKLMNFLFWPFLWFGLRRVTPNFLSFHTKNRGRKKSATRERGKRGTGPYDDWPEVWSM